MKISKFLEKAVVFAESFKNHTVMQKYKDNFFRTPKKHVMVTCVNVLISELMKELNDKLRGHPQVGEKGFGKHTIKDFIKTIQTIVDEERERLRKRLDFNGRPTGTGAEFNVEDHAKLFCEVIELYEPTKKECPHGTYRPEGCEGINDVISQTPRVRSVDETRVSSFRSVEETRVSSYYYFQIRGNAKMKEWKR